MKIRSTLILCFLFTYGHAMAASLLCQDAGGNRAKIDIPAQGSVSQNCINECDGGYYGDPVTDCHFVCDLEETRMARLTLQAYGKSFQSSFKINSDPKNIGYGFYGDTEIHSDIKYEISLRGPHKPEQPNVTLYVGAFDLNGDSVAQPLFLNCVARQ